MDPSTHPMNGVSDAFLLISHCRLNESELKLLRTTTHAARAIWVRIGIHTKKILRSF
jgi:hypothetical protein